MLPLGFVVALPVHFDAPERDRRKLAVYRIDMPMTLGFIQRAPLGWITPYSYKCPCSRIGPPSGGAAP